jgi:hypothetical protein
MPKKPQSTNNAVEVAKPEHCFYCFDVLSAQLNNEELPEFDHEDANLEL